MVDMEHSTAKRGVTYGESHTFDKLPFPDHVNFRPASPHLKTERPLHVQPGNSPHFPTKEPRSTASARSSFRHLFVFVDRHHVLLVAGGVLAAMSVAAGRTIYAILIGKIFQLVSQWGAGALTGDVFMLDMSRLCVLLCVLGICDWLLNSLDMTLWVVSGELTAKRARRTLFASLLRKSMGWYDARENGIASLIVGIQTYASFSLIVSVYASYCHPQTPDPD